LVQSDFATIWDQVRGLDVLLQHFKDQSELHSEVRSIMETRAGMLVSPAAFLLAFLAPTLRMGELTEAEKTVGIAWHAKMLGPASASFATCLANFRRPVPQRPISQADFVGSQRPRPGAAPQIAQQAVHDAVVQLLLGVVPTEASVERVFSQVKRNMVASRTRAKPAAATAQVLHNNYRTRLAGAITIRTSKLAPEVSADGFMWIVKNGATKLPLTAQQPTRDERYKCGSCHAAHQGGDWWGCSKCGQWYFIACLRLYLQAAEMEKIRNARTWECNMTEYCESLPAGYICDDMSAEEVRTKTRRR
jgi:hypothetical protein